MVIQLPGYNLCIYYVLAEWPISFLGNDKYIAGRILKSTFVIILLSTRPYLVFTNLGICGMGWGCLQILDVGAKSCVQYRNLNICDKSTKIYKIMKIHEIKIIN